MMSDASLDNSEPFRKMGISSSGSNSVVECHLAKVKVASSNLVSRSRYLVSRAMNAQRDGEYECGATEKTNRARRIPLS
jgi:hypothetical protein